MVRIALDDNLHTALRDRKELSSYFSIIYGQQKSAEGLRPLHLLIFNSLVCSSTASESPHRPYPVFVAPVDVVLSPTAEVLGPR